MGAHWIEVAGRPASRIAPHGPLTYESLADGGCGAASFSFSIPPRSQHHALRPGHIVRGMTGPVPSYAGEITGYDRQTGKVTVRGIAAAATGYFALDEVGNATRNIATAAIVAAQAGWPVVSATLTGTAAGDTSNGPQRLSALFDDMAADLGARWGIDRWQRYFMRADPDPATVAPQWRIKPGVATFGTTAEGVPSHYVARYDNGTNYLSVIVPHPDASRMVYQAEDLDLTDRGTLGVMQATAIAGGEHALHSGRGRRINGVTLYRDQLTTIGGTPAAPEQVRGGQLARAMGVAVDGLSPGMWHDFVIGTVLHTQGEDELYIEPVNTAPRSHAAVIAAL